MSEDLSKGCRYWNGQCTSPHALMGKYTCKCAFWRPKTSAEIMAEQCVQLVRERDEARAEVERLTKERDDALSSKDHCQQWHAVRLKRLEDWFRNEGKDLTIAMEFWNIVANGTKSVNDPPTYSQQMNMLRHEVERLKAVVHAAEGILSGLEYLLPLEHGSLLHRTLKETVYEYRKLMEKRKEGGR